ncbi:hypothetical protein [Streptomyces sp. NPDC048338]|uniref:hypothetical protein n=1 Tax=Streptomyces sp. NPDC048338 TaxID=3365536 RepID=UPI00371267C6
MTGRQKLYEQAEDELLDPRAPALPDRGALAEPADALVAASHGEYRDRGEVVLFAACTAARTGEVSGCRTGLTGSPTPGSRCTSSARSPALAH